VWLCRGRGRGREWWWIYRSGRGGHVVIKRCEKRTRRDANLSRVCTSIHLITLFSNYFLKPPRRSNQRSCVVSFTTDYNLVTPCPSTEATTKGLQTCLIVHFRLVVFEPSHYHLPVPMSIIKWHKVVAIQKFFHFGYQNMVMIQQSRYVVYES
jgi:hypothetical protein